MPTDPMWCFENYGEAAEYIDQLEKQRDELLEALEQERKRLDWALKHDSFYDHTTGVFFCDPAFKILNPQVRVETDDPRAAIDSLMVQS